MKCTVWRSCKKAGLYVYLLQGKDLKDLPVDLREMLGRSQQAMELDLSQYDCLASEDISVVRKNLREFGYHLQLPPLPLA